MSWTDLTQLSNLVAWYKSESLSASYANGDPISTWADSSGNSRDLTGTTTTRPLAAANSINGYMAASFDGLDDILSSSSYTVGGKTYVSIVVNYPSDISYNGLIGIDGNSTPSHVCDFFTCYGFSSGGWIIGRGAPTQNVQSFPKGTPGVLSAATDTILSTSASADGFLFRANGTTAYSQSGGSNLATHTGTGYVHLGNVGIVGQDTTNGDIAEVAIWEDTSDKSIAWVEGYLAHKYGITLADGHLFKNDPPSSAPPTYNPSGGLFRVGLNGGM